MRQWQQGDVILQEVIIPKGNFERIADPVLQWGEVTNHAHRLQMFTHEGNKASAGVSNPKWELLLDKETKTKYLNVFEPTALSHEEHHTITIPPGEYRIGIVQEYDHFAEEARQVLD